MQYYDYGNLLYEAARFVPISEHISFSYDLKEENSSNDEVMSEIEVVTNLFEERDYSTLKRDYNDHALTRAELSGFRSLHIFPNSKLDIVIVYKSHKKALISSFIELAAMTGFTTQITRKWIRIDK